MPTSLPPCELIKGWESAIRSTREDQGLDVYVQTPEHFNTPLIEEILLISTPPLPSIFPAIKMFPELRYKWKVLENPTGRRLGQENSFSHAIQEALNKMFALQDNSAQEPNSRGWRIMVGRRALWGTGAIESIWVLILTMCQPQSLHRVYQSPSDKQDSSHVV